MLFRFLLNKYVWFVLLLWCFFHGDRVTWCVYAVVVFLWYS